MSDIILKADATFGLKVIIGDKVKPGQQIGTAIETSEPLLAPLGGLVESVFFNAAKHTLEVRLSPDVKL